MLFVNWSKVSGYRKGLSIDRIDNDGPYAPWNCRWTDSLTQANNRSSNRYISVCGSTYSLADCARIIGVQYSLLQKKSDSEIATMTEIAIPEMTKENINAKIF